MTNGGDNLGPCQRPRRMKILWKLTEHEQHSAIQYAAEIIQVTFSIEYH